MIIYNKLGKNPVLAIEVDGYEYHKKETIQSKRDKMKNEILESIVYRYFVFSTTGSEEKKVGCQINGNPQIPITH